LSDLQGAWGNLGQEVVEARPFSQSHNISPIGETNVETKICWHYQNRRKGSDVNLAVHLLNDSLLDKYDCAVIVSNDSDLAESLRKEIWNCGELAGQTIMHAHIHLIPRRKGDTPNPRGRVRGVIPEKMVYWDYRNSRANNFQDFRWPGCIREYGEREVRKKKGVAIFHQNENWSWPFFILVSFLLVEAKLSDARPSSALSKFQTALEVPAVQLTEGGDTFRIFRNGDQSILVAPAHIWIARLP